MRLLDPPLRWPCARTPATSSGYLPGVRENGGQYTHAAIWAAMAFARLGDAPHAWMLLDAINPVNHARKLSDTQVYRTEPYVMSADVYAHPPHAGRGGWSWYTGSAGWMYQLILESVLGLTLEHRDGKAWLRLHPCLPPHWPGCEIRYRFGDTTYRITLARQDALAADALSVDGVAQAHSDIALRDDGRPHEAVLSLATTQRTMVPDSPREH